MTHGVYEVDLKVRKGCIYVSHICPRPDLKGQLLYCWPVDFKLGSLSQNAIKNSMALADDIMELETSKGENEML